MRYFMPVVALLALFTITVSFSVSAMAQQELPPPLEHLRQNGVSLTYIGDAYGLQAWLARAEDGSRQTMYLTPDGRAIITGLMYDGEGYNVTERQLLDLLAVDPDALTRDPAVSPPPRLPAPAAAASAESAEYERMLAEVAETNWLEMGQQNATAPVLYMISDPNCPFCAQAWDRLRPVAEAGNIRLRIVLTGRLRDTSLAKSAGILGAEDPMAAFTRYHGPRQLAPGNVSPVGAERVAENEMFTGRYDITSTPTFIFRRADGSAHVIRGLPRDLQASILSQL